MVALAAGGLGAALGFATIGGQLGLSIGWMVGSWVFNNFLSKGSEQVIDPGAQELPLVNQELRGTPIMQVFGTMRVQSNIVWQNNFQTISHKNKQKSGGLGGSGGGGGGSVTSISYTYKIDLIYHMGIVPQDYYLVDAILFCRNGKF